MNTENGIDETLEVTEQEESEISSEASESDVVELAGELDWKAEAEKMKELYENQKIRAEKAEEKAKKPQVRPLNKEELSTLDIIALSKADIDPDDIEEVLDYAKFKKISVQEALKSSVVKSSIAEKDELRKSAVATNTGTSRRGSASTSDEQLLANARKGIMPDTDADMARLVQIRRERK